MDVARLRHLLGGFERSTVLVLGDYFLDKYLIIDPQLSEVSLETGLEAHQVVDVRCSPGAAGNLAANLRAMDVGVVSLGTLGDDGEGWELSRQLEKRGVSVAHMVTVPGRLNSTYTKPMVQKSDGSERELNRLDVKDRSELGREVEELLVEHLRSAVHDVDAVAVVDQDLDLGCGVLTNAVRTEMEALAQQHPRVFFVVDSRRRLGMYRHVLTKPNANELLQAVRPGWQGDISRALLDESAKELSRRTAKPVYVTLGSEGVFVYEGDRCEHVTAVRVEGPIDPVGAGDSLMAGITASLCSGATLAEAALVGNLVASVTIQQIGVTGTASREQVLERFQQSTQAGAASY